MNTKNRLCVGILASAALFESPDWQAFDLLEWPIHLLEGLSAMERKRLRRWSQLPHKRGVLSFLVGNRGVSESLIHAIQEWTEWLNCKTFLYRSPEPLKSGDQPLFGDLYWDHPESSQVVDPLWRRLIPRGTKILKVHGWHPERWQRKYGALTLQNLALKIKKSRHAPQQIIFGHSQRFDEAQQFLKWL